MKMNVYEKRKAESGRALRQFKLKLKLKLKFKRGCRLQATGTQKREVGEFWNWDCGLREGGRWKAGLG